jgi:copper homeostasis protein
MRKIVFELCSERIDACLAARDGGADRIELCSALSEGGLTPSHGLVRAAVTASGLPVHVLIRPRGGDFFYSESEYDLMAEDILHAKALGAAGVVLGILDAEGRVDLLRTRSLVQLAHPLPVTFHRAFDATPSLPQALEDVIQAGCTRVLTSGGEDDVVAGVPTLAALIEQTKGRIDVAVGGGLRLQNAGMLARETGAEHFHGSLRCCVDAHGARSPFTGSEPDRAPYVVEAETIRELIQILSTSCIAPGAPDAGR